MRLALIGKELHYSFSAAFFAQKFKQLNLPSHSYVNLELPQIEDVKEILASPLWSGFNITIPYKKAIIPYLDRLSEDAQIIGAVNTVVRQGQQWVGYNTDHIGFRDAVKETWPQLKVSKALILGSGGASQGVHYALNQLGMEVLSVSRKPSQNQIGYAEAQSVLGEYKLIVNTTPLGTFPKLQESPPLWPKGDLTKHYFVDLIYNPAQTKWLQLARENGAQTLNGALMLERQAEASWEIWQSFNRKQS
jgi:shikimate dehydrogenase